MFITTSVFTGEAREYVKTIILIDGTMLARLMTEYGVGVAETARYVVRRIDSDYFETDGERDDFACRGRQRTHAPDVNAISPDPRSS